uniref:Uncharacterized protein n=1 Tax=Pithovirus LCPAC401 TaxID=2506595 RepID=A0A481ZAT6_9VIRU|nr:MAG: hypothetical protein LCPAC401_03840 [Pithovirus LCPAC401]
MDEDLLNVVQEKESEYKNLGGWVIREEDTQRFWEWMPVYVNTSGHEIRIYCVNVWKSSPKFKTFICVRVLAPGVLNEVVVDERTDVDQDWIIERLNGEVKVQS